MSELTCGICLDDLKSPVSTPCGHLHCKKCINEHVTAGADVIQSTCPTCRAPFYTVTMDPTFVPAKYHPFIIPALRRIYLNADPSRSSAASRQLQEQLSAIKKENEDLASKLKGRNRDIKLLLTKCESNMAAASTHAKGERDARLENERLRDELDQLAERHNALQAKFAEREHRPGSSAESDARLSDDRRDHPRNHSRLIPDPSGIAKVNGCPVNEPVHQTNGGTEGTPTVVHKRKFKASTASTSLSTSSSGSSSAPSSPTSDVDREDSIPGERLMHRLPRRLQATKRPRLDFTPPGGGVTLMSVQARQTFALPPVSRRRPSTPVNRPPGESGVSGDQGGGSGHVGGNGDDGVEAGGDSPDGALDFSSDDSLNLDIRPHRRR